jgi:hypothetical protein
MGDGENFLQEKEGWFKPSPSTNDKTVRNHFIGAAYMKSYTIY